MSAVELLFEEFCYWTIWRTERALRARGWKTAKCKVMEGSKANRLKSYKDVSGKI